MRYLIAARGILKATPVASNLLHLRSLDYSWQRFVDVVVTQTSKLERVSSFCMLIVSGIGWGGVLLAKTGVCVLLASKVLFCEPEYFAMDQLRKPGVIIARMTHCPIPCFDFPA